MNLVLDVDDVPSVDLVSHLAHDVDDVPVDLISHLVLDVDGVPVDLVP